MAQLTATTANPKFINKDGKNYLSDSSKTNSELIDFVLDDQWMRQAFLINDASLSDATDINNRYWSTASYKFTDTKMGGNIGVNSRPQFCRYSDIRVKGRYKGLRKDVTLGSIGGNFGMGRYYSEAIDDPAQTIYLRFGVPQFNSVIGYLRKAFDPDLGTLAKTGRGTTIFYDTAKLVGTVIGVRLFPVFSLAVAIGKTMNLVFGGSSSKYYNLKPTMHLYWTAVNKLANTIAINRGLLPKMMDNSTGTRLGTSFKLDSDYLKELERLIPDMFRDGHYFDIYAIANRAQRMSDNATLEDYENLNKGTATDYTGYLKLVLSSAETHPTYLTNNQGNPTLAAWIDNVAKFSKYFGNNPNATLMELDPRIDPNDPEETKPKDPSILKDFFTYFDAELRDGAQYAIFKVDSTGAVSESFSNTVAESDLSSKLNGMSSTARQARFSFGEGATGSDIIDSALGAVADIGKGLLAGATFNFSNFIFGLAGTGYLDIPKYWQSSNASLPRASYNIQLISPYGNIISQMQNIYIPLSMLLAGALPLSTGKQSYTSPFICQLFDRGRCQVKLGMIENLTINRGTSHLPFNTKGEPLAIDVSFSIVDLSSIMHMPLSSGGLLDYDTTIDEDNILTDYLAVLAGQDLYSQMYILPRARLRLAKMGLAYNRITSPAFLASAVHNFLPTGIIEGVVRGSAVASNSLLR